MALVQIASCILTNYQLFFEAAVSCRTLECNKTANAKHRATEHIIRHHTKVLTLKNTLGLRIHTQGTKLFHRPYCFNKLFQVNNAGDCWDRSVLIHKLSLRDHACVILQSKMKRKKIYIQIIYAWIKMKKSVLLVLIRNFFFRVNIFSWHAINRTNDHYYNAKEMSFSLL